MTIEQRRALALAAARARAAQAGGAGGQPGGSEPSEEPMARAGAGSMGLTNDTVYSSGINDAVIKAYLGVKQLIPGVGLSENDQHALEGMRMERQQETSPVKRGVGEFGGNVLLTAVPATRATKMLTGTLGATGRLAPYFATAGAAGGTEFVTSVGTGSDQLEQVVDKLKNAGKAAVIAPVLQKVIGSTLNTIAEPFRAKLDAKKLFEQGVNPTLQQGAEGGFGRFVGGLAAGSSKVRDRQEAEVLDAVTRRATENTRSAMGGTGKEHLKTAEGYVDDLYSSLTQGKRFNLTPGVRQQAAQAASQLNKQGQFANEANEAGAAVGNIMGDSPVNLRLGIDRLRNEYLTPLAQAREAASNATAAGRINDARDVIKQQVLLKALNPQEQARHAQADTLNFDVNRLKEAVGKFGEDEGVTLSRLASAYGGKSDAAAKVANKTEEELIGPAIRILGRTPTQDEARALKVTLQRMTAPAVIAGTAPVAPAAAAAMAPFYGVSLAGQTAGGAKALLGQTEAQKRFAEILRRYAEQGRGAAASFSTSLPEE